MGKCEHKNQKSNSWGLVAIAAVVVAGVGVNASPDASATPTSTASTTSVMKTTTTVKTKSKTKTTPKPTPAKSGCWNREDWARDFLTSADLPTSDINIQSVIAWEIAEGGHFPVPGTSRSGAKFNPINTTLGSSYPSYNSVHVRNFPSYEVGIKENASTVKQNNMRAIYNALKKQSTPADVAQAIVSSPWGTSPVIKQDINEAARQMAGTSPQSCAKGN